MSSTAFTIIATNATGSSNSAVVFIEVLGAPVPSGFSFSGSGVPIGGSCPYAASGEVFEQATQQHVIEPYTTSISVSAEYEALNCMYGNCPGANDTYSFMNLASNAFAVESGEAGSFGGKASIFAYDVASTAFTFANGSNGGNGTVEIQPAKTIKYCAKVIDARGVNGAASAQTLAFTPSVDFQKVTYSTFTYSLPAISPSTAFPQRTQNQAIGVYKKLDTSVRDWIIKQYIEPRFQ